MIDPQVLTAYVEEIRRQREEERYAAHAKALTEASLRAIEANNRYKLTKKGTP